MEREVPSYTVKNSLRGYPHHNLYSQLSRPTSLPVFEHASYREHGSPFPSPYYNSHGHYQDAPRRKEDRRADFMIGDPMLVSHSNGSQHVSPRFMSPQFIREHYYDSKYPSNQTYSPDKITNNDLKISQFSPAHMSYSPIFQFESPLYENRTSYSTFRRESPFKGVSPSSNVSCSPYKLAPTKDPSPPKVSPNYRDSKESRLHSFPDDLRLLDEARYRNQVFEKIPDLQSNCLPKSGFVPQHNDPPFRSSANDKIQQEFAHRFLLENYNWKDNTSLDLPNSKDFEDLRSQLMPKIEHRPLPMSSRQCRNATRQSVICVPSKYRHNVSSPNDAVTENTHVVEERYSRTEPINSLSRARERFGNGSNLGFEKYHSAPNLFEKVFNIGSDLKPTPDINSWSPVKEPHKTAYRSHGLSHLGLNSERPLSTREAPKPETREISRILPETELKDERYSRLIMKLPKNIVNVDNDNDNDMEMQDSNGNGLEKPFQGPKRTYDESVISNASNSKIELSSHRAKVVCAGRAEHVPEKQEMTCTIEKNPHGAVKLINEETRETQNKLPGLKRNKKDVLEDEVLNGLEENSAKRKKYIDNGELENELQIDAKIEEKSKMVYEEKIHIDTRDKMSGEETSGKSEKDDKVENLLAVSSSGKFVDGVNESTDVLSSGSSSRESVSSEDTGQESATNKRTLSREERAIQYAMQKFKEMEEKKKRRGKGKVQDSNEKSESQKMKEEKPEIANNVPPLRLKRKKFGLRRKRKLGLHGFKRGNNLSKETDINISKEEIIHTERKETNKIIRGHFEKRLKKHKRKGSKLKNTNPICDLKHHVQQVEKQKEIEHKKPIENNEVFHNSSHDKDLFHGKGDMHQKSYLLVPSYKGFKDFSPIVLEGRTRQRSTQHDVEKVGKPKFPILVIEKVGEKRNEILVRENEDLETKMAKESLLAEKVFEHVDDDDGKLKSNLKHLSCNRMTGETVLHKAARLGYDDVVDIKIKEGADVNARDNAGWTALHEACVRGKKEVVRVLLRHGADPNCRSENGIRPIHDAVESSNIDIIRLLIRYGADVSEETYSGMKIVQLARTEQVRRFLHGYIGDIQAMHLFDIEDEKSIETWEFRGTVPSLDKQTDDSSEIFGDFPGDSDVQIEFTASSKEPLPTYNLPCYSNNQRIIGYRNYYLLDDVLATLSVTRSCFFKKHKVELRTMPWCEFVNYVNQSQTSILPNPPPSSSDDEDPMIDLIHIGNFTARKLFDMKTYQV